EIPLQICTGWLLWRKDTPGGRTGGKRKSTTLHTNPDRIYHDEPDVKRQAAAEDFSLHIDPPTWRSSELSLSMAWFGLMSAMFWVVVGSTVALTVGTFNTLIGIVLSTIVYGFLCNVASRFAARSGTSVALFSRA